MLVKPIKKAVPILSVKRSNGSYSECSDCHFYDMCMNDGIEYCEIRDGGTPPEDAVCYDIENGVEIVDDEVSRKDDSSGLETDRTIYLQDDINKRTVLPIIKKIIEVNKEDADVSPDERIPVKIYISCDGGEEAAGNALIDVIEQSLTPIYAIGVGTVYSMAALVFLAAHKRFAFEKSEFLFHDGVCDSASNASAKLYDTIDFIKCRNNKIRDYVLCKTNIPACLYDSKYREEWYMFASEAQNYGVVDKIIGRDADLYDIM